MRLPWFTKLSITDQGAAVATLIHAFLYYTITNHQYPYKLNLNTPLQLKSYVFAQPKPGNLQLAQDFARISKDIAFVINNDRDPVPQVPLSLETSPEVATFVEEDSADIGVGGSLDHIVETITDTKNKF